METVSPVQGRFCRCAATTTHSSRSGCQRSSHLACLGKVNSLIVTITPQRNHADECYAMSRQYAQYLLNYIVVSNLTRSELYYCLHRLQRDHQDVGVQYPPGN